MEPERRLIERLHDKGAADDDEAREEYDEHRRSVAGVDEAVVKPARLAMGRQTEEATEQLTPAAARAPAHQPGKQRRHRRMGGRIRHDIPRKSRTGAVSAAPCPEKDPTGLETSVPGGLRCACSPHIYAGEQEEPHHVNEVPVPGGEFKPETLLGRELTGKGANEAHDQENR